MARPPQDAAELAMTSQPEDAPNLWMAVPAIGLVLCVLTMWQNWPVNRPHPQFRLHGVFAELVRAPHWWQALQAAQHCCRSGLLQAVQY